MVVAKPTLPEPPRSEVVHDRRKQSGVVRAQRLHQRTELFVEIAFTSEGGSAIGYARNISLGGMYVETTDPAPFGTKVTLHVPLPGFDDLADIEAIVRWQDDAGMGLQFGTMGAKLTFALTELAKQ